MKCCRRMPRDSAAPTGAVGEEGGCLRTPRPVFVRACDRDVASALPLASRPRLNRGGNTHLGDIVLQIRARSPAASFSQPRRIGAPRRSQDGLLHHASPSLSRRRLSTAVGRTGRKGFQPTYEGWLSNPLETLTRFAFALLLTAVAGRCGRRKTRRVAGARNKRAKTDARVPDVLLVPGRRLETNATSPEQSRRGLREAYDARDGDRRIAEKDGKLWITP